MTVIPVIRLSSSLKTLHTLTGGRTMTMAKNKIETDLKRSIGITLQSFAATSHEFP